MCLSYQSCLSHKTHQLIGLSAVTFQNYFCESTDKGQEKNTKIYQQLRLYLSFYSSIGFKLFTKPEDFILYSQFTKLIRMFLSIN